MPELPEVETIVRELAGLAGKRLVAVECWSRLVAPGPLGAAAGRRIRAVRRHGKNILVECDGGLLWVHLGMTGKLLAGGGRGPYTHAAITTDAGVVWYDDVRQFGRIVWCEGMPERLERLGPDPLAVTAGEFLERLAARRGRIKTVLLDQEFLRGLGNIYADEALYRARLHPLTPAPRIGRKRAEALHAAIVEVLELAIEHRGSSVSDYVDAAGRRGSFQVLHQVYRKQGQPCPRCGTAIRRIVAGGRGTHYCPKCQKK